MRGRKYTIEDWRAVERALAAGETIDGASEATGVSRSVVHRWSHMDGPPDRLWTNMEIEAQAAGRPRQPGARLTYEDRVMIYALLGGGRSHQEIADAVGCHRSTVSRELARLPEGGYDPRLAQLDAERAARRPKERKLDADPRLRAYVVNALALRWSPEQISRRAREDFPGDEGMRVSCETIYQALYVQGNGQLRHELGVELALRSGRKGRKPRSKLPSRRGSKPWVEGREISERPPEAADRAVPGHWEGDLVVGGDMASCLVTLVERRSRFLLMSRLLAHDADTVEERLAEMVASIPDELKRTLTWDQGPEMARVADFELATPFRVYFCDPSSPWQRPTNENTNGLVREFFPKGTRFAEVTDEEVARAQWLLNNRPRKALGWKFPSEVMREVLAEGAMTA